MAKHEFGIMPIDPVPGQRFDRYEPEQYHCISVDDCDLENILDRFVGIDFYWHTLDKPGSCLAYCGITLIPPKSMDAFLRVIEPVEKLGELSALVRRAKAENKFIIHFGI